MYSAEHADAQPHLVGVTEIALDPIDFQPLDLDMKTDDKNPVGLRTGNIIKKHNGERNEALHACFTDPNATAEERQLAADTFVVDNLGLVSSAFRSLRIHPDRLDSLTPDDLYQAGFVWLVQHYTLATRQRKL